jgi:hypothetical protein
MITQFEIEKMVSEAIRHIKDDGVLAIKGRDIYEAMLEDPEYRKYFNRVCIEVATLRKGNVRGMKEIMFIFASHAIGRYLAILEDKNERR